MANDLLLLFLGFAVGCLVGYKLGGGSGAGSILPQQGFLRPKSWDKQKENPPPYPYQPKQQNNSQPSRHPNDYFAQYPVNNPPQHPSSPSFSPHDYYGEQPPKRPPF